MKRSTPAGDSVALWIDLAAITTSAAFAGGALYISLVHQPVRMRLCRERGATEALLGWAYSYNRAAPIQASLAVLTAAFGGLGAWVAQRGGRGVDRAWLVGCLAVGANVPLTLLWVMPLNDRLKLRAARALEQEEAAEASAEAAEEDEAGCPSLCFGAFALKGAPSTTCLLRAWGYAHAVRTVLGCAGFAVLAYQAVVARRTVSRG